MASCQLLELIDTNELRVCAKYDVGRRRHTIHNCVGFLTLFQMSQQVPTCVLSVLTYIIANSFVRTFRWVLWQ